MATTIKETVTVDSLGKWGPKVGNEYYSWSKGIKESDKGKVVPGGTYEMELYIAESGKRYINSVVDIPTHNISGIAAMNKPVIPKETPFKHEMKVKVTDNMSKEEWAAKNRQISRQGVIQVAVQVTNSFEDAVELAEKMLGFVNK